MLKVAVTGGISSGKSTVCNFLAELGAYVVSADEIVHHILTSDPISRQKIVSLLGQDVLVQDQLDRKSIAQKVFSQEEKRKLLEAILHPLVFYEIELQYNIVKNNANYRLFIAEIPLLYETESEALFDCVITVVADEKKRQQRFLHKKTHTLEEFVLRTNAQLPSIEKEKRAHFALYNNGSKKELQKEVVKLLKQLLANHT